MAQEVDDDDASDSSSVHSQDESKDECASANDVAFDIRPILFELASSALDTKTGGYRHTLVVAATEAVRSNNGEARRILATEWEGLTKGASSVHAFRRIVPLFTESLMMEGADQILVERLCQGLVRCCGRAGDPYLLEKQSTRLKQCDNSSNSGTTGLARLLQQETDAVVASVAIGSVLDPSLDWLKILIECTVTTAMTTSIEANELELARHFLQSLTMAQWNADVSPVLLLKLKSHPDKALSMILGWVKHIKVASTEEFTMDEEWVTLLLKHLTSGKEENRLQAMAVLLELAGKSSSSFGMITTALATAKTSLAPARVAIYVTLEQLAIRTPSTEATSLIGEILSSLTGLVQKELKADHREVGYAALVQWMVLAKRSKNDIKGYNTAVEELIRKPIKVKKANDAASLLYSFARRVHPDLLESIARDIWAPDDKAWNSGIEAVLVSASSKKSTQVDGVLFVYFGLLYANQVDTKVPAYLTKHVSAGATRKGDSFLYSESMMETICSNDVVATLIHRIIALYTEIASKKEMDKCLFVKGKITSATTALALAALYSSRRSSSTKDEHISSKEFLNSLDRVVTHLPFAVDCIVDAVEKQIDVASRKREQIILASNSTREARESELSKQSKFDYNTVRRGASALSRYCSDASTYVSLLILTHAGSTLRQAGRQRAALVLNTKIILRRLISMCEGDEFLSAVRSSLAEKLACCSLDNYGNTETSEEPSQLTHQSGLSLILTLGCLGSEYLVNEKEEQSEDFPCYSFAYTVCTSSIAPKLSAKLIEVLGEIDSMSVEDVRLLKSPAGTLILPKETNTSTAKKTTNKRLTEEEEWEIQMKKELAEKKSASSSVSTEIVTPQDKKMLADQDSRRSEITKIVNIDFTRILETIRSLCLSDVEVGHGCLLRLSAAVLAATASISPPMMLLRELQENSFETLSALGSCVYEVDENFARTMATSLLLACRKTSDGPVSPQQKKSDSKENLEIEVYPLPSACAPVASLIKEINDYGDTLSVASYIFLFPILKAALMGPRAPLGCEAALRLVERHTQSLFMENKNMGKLRKETVVSVLELLKHDRALTFHDPTPFDTLSTCFVTSSDGPMLSTAELAPLLDERGALGSRNCRIGSMMALARIAKDHRKLVKANPLIENRIWLNCFDTDDNIRNNARQAWANLHAFEKNDVVLEAADLPRPSPLYAPPLVALFTHSDGTISKAAADAYAHAMGTHPNSVERNIELLCTTFINSFPVDGDSNSQSAPLPPNKGTTTPKLTAAPKKKIVTGLPKKKSAGKSALAVAGIGKPKSTKKKTTNSALLKPKQERTLDQNELASQFKTSGVQKVEEEKDSSSKIAVRLGVLQAIAAFSVSSIKVQMDEKVLKLLTSFLIAYGIADVDEIVKGVARNALRDVVATNGDSDEAIAFLLPHLEDVLKNGIADEHTLGELPKNKVPRDVHASDRRKEGAVVALGSIALHLKGPDNEEKVENTVDMLIGALRTPSEEVQLSVADALTKLMKKGKIQTRIASILSNLLEQCLQGETMATRRGASYGLAAAVKGSGITTLKKYEVIKQLEEACASGGPNSKEGSLFAIELLSSRLGLLFEPYVIVLLPSLLKAFSDSSDYVRKAANNTAGLIMSKLSAHGVKLVMPAVLTAFDDPAWRTKQASIHMLGAMSHLAPKQLASALPKVVPQLTEAFSDTHTKVKASAQEALFEISTVVKNPEISSITTILLKALTDPADNTIKALEALIQTEFLHAIDAPSLALIAPILHRGLRDRGATTKRLGGLIAGNICTMINDPKDFVPYLPTLLPDLKTALLDPIPDVRSTSAKALGSLTRSLGEHILLELRPWLIQQLRDESCSSAERSGAAQGLTEVLIASGSSVVEETMRSDILPLRSYPEAGTREGVLWMLTFLPPALGQGFTPLIDVSLPALIKGLSDDSEPVRDVALRAGRVLIRSHGKVHVDKILPSLETGLSDDDHRIRVASLSLLGDLLSMIGGTQVLKGDGDTQDDMKRAERAQAQIAITLGTDTRKRVLSGLYLARCDSVHMVRQSAIQVWKTVVSVTVRALRDILPVLVAKIIGDLASGNEDMTDAAGRCLGDIVGKLGDSVLPQIIPVLRNTLYEGDAHSKRGVCVGLTEVIKCSTKDQILRFIEIIVKVIQDALSDDDDVVRKMASSSFQSLHAVVGSRAMDEVVPSLMVALESGEDDEISRVRALNGLTGILSVRSRELLPYIVPRLIERPISTNHAQILSGVARVTGSTIHFHFSTILPALLGELADGDDKKDDENEEAIRNCSREICGSVDTTGVNWLIGEIASKCCSDKASFRRESCRMFEYVVSKRAERADFYEQVPIILRELLYRLNDENEAVLKANHSAFAALTKNVPAEELVKHIEFMRNLLSSMVSDARRRKGGVGDGEFLLPGFNLPKGLEPLIPIYQRGILYGSSTIREVSASGLGEVIGYTSSKFLAGPLIVKMTGPLLRIVGDRNPSNVKVAILKTLGLVLTKGGPALRAFVPQFQTTFVKALSDPSRLVRVEAISALSLLMPLSTRVDPLIKELVSGSLGKNAAIEGLAVTAVQTATLEALTTVLEKGGTKAKLPASVPSALDASKELLMSPDDGIRESAAKAMGISCSLLGPTVATETLQDEVLNSKEEEAKDRHGKACAIRRILSCEVGSSIDESVIEGLKAMATRFLQDDKISVREAGFAALCSAIGRSHNPKASLRSSEPELMKVFGNSKEPLEIHRAIARGLCVSLEMVDKKERVQFMGVKMLDKCLEMSLKSSQRVQYAFNDVLWLALDVSGGQDGLDQYCGIAVFENQRSMKSLHTKVLARIKEISILNN